MVIETFDLGKVYGKKTACSGINLAVEPGQIFGLLGPNGAGKSTIIKMLTGLVIPTAGTATVLGRPVHEVALRRKIGFLPENFKYQEWMTGKDLLSFHAALYQLDKRCVAARIDAVLEMVKLRGQEQYRVGTYSKGMQQRLGLAAALLADPELLFLDEPTSALDPLGRKEVRDLILDLKARGKSVLLNSHLLNEVEQVCDSAAIINRGKIVVQGSLNAILGGNYTLELRVQNTNSAMLEQLRQIDPALVAADDLLTLAITTLDVAPEVARIVVQNGGLLFGLTPHRDNLENRFIRLIDGEVIQ